MKKEVNINFIQYSLENLTNVKVPNSKDKYFELENLESICELLILFLNFEISETTLKRVLSNFENDFQVIYEFDLKQLASAIESLAANFEPFLKKIAYIKFNNNELWNGIDNKKGIKDCTLFELIEGGFTIPNEKFKIIPFPNEIVCKTGPSKAILDFVRSNLRNSVHDAKAYTRIQLAEYSNLVLSSYLIAINDNIDFFKEKFFIEYNYLRKLTKSTEFIEINRNYVEIYGKKIDLNKTVSNVPSIDFVDVNIDIETEFNGIDTVVNIAEETHNFIIIGEPGSGKSTSLKKIAFNNAIALLENTKFAKFPILIKASLYSKQNNFLKLLENEINSKEIELNYLIHKYSVLILIDGINEIDDEFKLFAINELNYLINFYPNIDFILSTRKFGFYNNFDIHTYELISFNEVQIKDFINKGLDSEIEAENFWTNIENNKTIFEIVTNPLMLNMFLNVFKNKNKSIPQNKALLYKLFIDKILEREKTFYNTKLKTKIDILSYLAFWMRANGYFKNLNSIKAKELINIKLMEIDHSIGSNQIIYELIDNNLILEDDENIEFQHETIQEYFVALELKNQFHSSNNLQINFSDNKWSDSLIMCSQLLKTEPEINKFYNLVFIGQKNNLFKPINLFNDSDINPTFYVGCKISYNIKNSYPNIYEISENNLLNYISIWLIMYKKNIEIFNFQNLLIAVANLSSFKVFISFFTNISILEYLFHNDEIENVEINYEKNKLFEERYNTFTSVFSESLNNTANFYKANGVISDNIDKIYSLNISKSIKTNYKKFLHYILNESSSNQLIEVFKVEHDKEILLFIGENDLAFFINNYKLVKSLKIQKVINFILKYHFKNPIIFDLITTIFLNDNIETEDKCQIISTLLKFNQYFDSTLNLLKILKNNNDIFLHDDSLKLLLNNFPIEILRTYELDTIFNTPDILEEKVILNYLSSDNKYNYYDIGNDKSKFVSNNIYIKDKQINIEVKQIDFINLRLTLLSKSQINDFIKEYEESKIIILEYQDHNNSNNSLYLKLKLKDVKKSNKNYYNSITLYLDCQLPPELNTNTNNKIFLHIKNKYDFIIDYIGVYQTKNVAAFDINIDSNHENNLILRFINPVIIFDKPHLYHRDILKNNLFYSNYLIENLKDYNKLDFYKKLSLLHLSPDTYEHEINYGIILNEFKFNFPCYTVYSITKNKLISNYLYTSYGYNLKINDIVLIENNIYISPIKTNEYIENFYIYSNITTYNNEKNEGFIYNDRDDKEKDYYFISKYCDFVPKIGDNVKFIPGINFSLKSNKKMPMAYSIFKIEDIEKIATVLKQLNTENNTKDCFEYILLDDLTQEILFTRIYKTGTNSINYELEIGKKYSYKDYTTKKNLEQTNINNRNKRVLLIESIIT